MASRPTSDPVANGAAPLGYPSLLGKVTRIDSAPLAETEYGYSGGIRCNDGENWIFIYNQTASSVIVSGAFPNIYGDDLDTIPYATLSAGDSLEIVNPVFPGFVVSADVIVLYGVKNTVTGG